MAKPVEFPQQNMVFGRNQEGVQPLPTFASRATKEGEVVSCWQLEPEEIEMLAKNGGKIWLTQLTFHCAPMPVYISPECPLTEEVNAPLN